MFLFGTGFGAEQALLNVVSAWLALGSCLTTSTACSLSKKLSKAKCPCASLKSEMQGRFIQRDLSGLCLNTSL